MSFTGIRVKEIEDDVKPQLQHPWLNFDTFCADQNCSPCFDKLKSVSNNDWW